MVRPRKPRPPRGRPPIPSDPSSGWAFGFAQAARVAGVAEGTIFRWFDNGQGVFTPDEAIYGPWLINGTYEFFGTRFSRDALVLWGKQAADMREYHRRGLIREEDINRFILDGGTFDDDMPDKPQPKEWWQRRATRLKLPTPVQEAEFYGYGDVPEFLEIIVPTTPDPIPEVESVHAEARELLDLGPVEPRPPRKYNRPLGPGSRGAYKKRGNRKPKLSYDEHVAQRDAKREKEKREKEMNKLEETEKVGKTP